MLVESAMQGDRPALARAITQVEAGGPQSELILEALSGSGDDAFVFGVTGAPGAGKSTLIGALLAHLRAADQRVAVVAVDPSSPFTRGALLGDRLRMTAGAADDGVFMRSMATRGQHGGLATATQAVVMLLGACGWPIVVIETAGVGQVEVDIASAADATAIVVNPGWGDEVQAGKAGLMEIGDVFVINKADRPGLEETRRDLSAQLARRPEADVPVAVLETIATEDSGVDELARWVLESRRAFMADPERARARRVTDALEVVCRQRLDARWRAVRDSGQFRQACEDVLAGRVSLAGAVDELLASAAE